MDDKRHSSQLSITYDCPARGGRIAQGVVRVAAMVLLVVFMVVPKATNVGHAQASDGASLAPRVLVLLQGINTTLAGPNDRADVTFREVRARLTPYYDDVVVFSYTGGTMRLRPQSTPVWSPLAYEKADTHQALATTAERLKALIDEYRFRFPGARFDLVGHSLGGAVAWEYAATYVMPDDGAHRDGVLRAVVTLDSPLNGVSHETITSWFQSAGWLEWESDFSNEVTRYLSSRADDGRQPFTEETNRRLADFLRDRRGVAVLTVASTDDCVVPQGNDYPLRSAAVPGHELILSLGRGETPAPDCGALGAAALPFLPGGLDAAPTNAGHDQVLRDGGVLAHLEDLARAGGPKAPGDLVQYSVDGTSRSNEAWVTSPEAGWTELLARAEESRAEIAPDLRRYLAVECNETPSPDYTRYTCTAKLGEIGGEAQALGSVIGRPNSQVLMDIAGLSPDGNLVWFLDGAGDATKLWVAEAANPEARVEVGPAGSYADVNFARNSLAMSYAYPRGLDSIAVIKTMQGQRELGRATRVLVPVPLAPDGTAGLFLEAVSDTTTQLRLLGPTGEDRGIVARGRIYWADFVQGGIAWTEVDGAQTRLWLAGPDGRGARSVLTLSGTNSISATTAPTGKHVFVTAYDPGSTGSFLLSLVSAPDGKSQALGRGTGDYWGGGAGMFSGNGESLTYSLAPGSNRYVLHLPTGIKSGPLPTSQVPLSYDGRQALLPDGSVLSTATGVTRPGPQGEFRNFSRDGRRILFRRDGSTYTSAPEGGAEVRVGERVWAQWAIGASDPAAPIVRGP